MQKEATMRRHEVEFLRFLRTKERPENFSTLKIIGKGAFGEVKLVQRKNDGKIYALKSLVKSEMVGLVDSLYIPHLVVSYSPSNSSKKTSLLTCALNVISWPRPTVLGSSSFTQLSRTTLSSICSWSSFPVVT